MNSILLIVMGCLAIWIIPAAANQSSCLAEIEKARNKTNTKETPTKKNTMQTKTNATTIGPATTTTTGPATTTTTGPATTTTTGPATTTTTGQTKTTTTGQTKTTTTSPATTTITGPTKNTTIGPAKTTTKSPDCYTIMARSLDEIQKLNSTNCSYFWIVYTPGYDCSRKHQCEILFTASTSRFACEQQNSTTSRQTETTTKSLGSANFQRRPTLFLLFNTMMCMMTYNRPIIY